MATITRLDRIQLAVRDRRVCASLWKRLFDAETVGEDRVPSLGARRSTLRVGENDLELLEADGLGRTAQHLSRAPTSIMAVGLAVDDLNGMRARLDENAVHHQMDGNQVWLSGEWLGIPGLQAVLSQDASRPPAGLLGYFCGVSHLTHNTRRAAERLLGVFDLDPALREPIDSELLGGCAIGVRFSADRADRVATANPTDRNHEAWRFFKRNGPCLYGVSVACARMRALRVRLDAEIPRTWIGNRAAAVPNKIVVPFGTLDRIHLTVRRETAASG